MVLKKTFKIQNMLGLHACPSASFVKIANKYKSNVTVETGKLSADGKSIVGLMTLGASFGNKIHVTVDGNDSDEAMNELSELLTSKNFNEE